MVHFPPKPQASQPMNVEDIPIDTTSPDDTRSSFRSSNYDAALPYITTRFPNIDPLYLTKIYRGTITPEGLVWLDVNREDATPTDFPSLAHLLYCFEVYGQIICTFAGVHGLEEEMELQKALSDYRLRLLKLSKAATFESLREWHKAFLEAQIRDGQDRATGWREKREELGMLLKRRI